MIKAALIAFYSFFPVPGVECHYYISHFDYPNPQDVVICYDRRQKPEKKYTFIIGGRAYWA